MNYGIIVDLSEQKFLAFLFIIPNNVDEVEQHEYFPIMFRNINNLGTQLDPMEKPSVSLFFEI